MNEKTTVDFPFFLTFPSDRTHKATTVAIPLNDTSEFREILKLLSAIPAVIPVTYRARQTKGSAVLSVKKLVSKGRCFLNCGSILLSLRCRITSIYKQNQKTAKTNDTRRYQRLIWHCSL
jgi:hypothetical protein